MMCIGNIIVITVRNDGGHVTTNTWAPGNRNIATTTTPVISKSRAWVGRHLDGGDGEQWGGRWVRARDATSPTYILFIIPFHCHHPPSQPRDSRWCVSSPRPKRQFTAIGRFLFTRTTARDANNNDNGPRWCVSHCLGLRWVLLIFLRVLYIYILILFYWMDIGCILPGTQWETDGGLRQWKRAQTMRDTSFGPYIIIFIFSSCF